MELDSAAYSLAFSPDGERLAIGTGGWSAEVWDLGTRGRTHNFPLGERCWAVAFSPDGSLLATGTRGGVVRQWDLSTGKPYGPPLHHPNAVANVAYRPDGRLLATVCIDLNDAQVSVRFWSAEPYLLREGFQLPIVPMWTLLMFTQDGHLVTNAQGSRAARVWRLPTSIPSFREVQLRSWTSLGAKRGPNGEAVAIPPQEWRALRDELETLQHDNGGF
jgi:WD40 repeat protein